MSRVKKKERRNHGSELNDDETLKGINKKTSRRLNEHVKK